jgi:hypothetical protein
MHCTGLNISRVGDIHLARDDDPVEVQVLLLEYLGHLLAHVRLPCPPLVACLTPLLGCWSPRLHPEEPFSAPDGRGARSGDTSAPLSSACLRDCGSDGPRGHAPRRAGAYLRRLGGYHPRGSARHTPALTREAQLGRWVRPRREETRPDLRGGGLSLNHGDALQSDSLHLDCAGLCIARALAMEVTRTYTHPGARPSHHHAATEHACPKRASNGVARVELHPPAPGRSTGARTHA